MAGDSPSFDAMPDESQPAAAPPPSFDSMPDESKAAQPSVLQSMAAPITDIPSTYSRMVNESVGQMGTGVGQLESGDPWTMAKGAGNVALGGLGYVTAPINAPLHTFVGEPVTRAAGTTAGTIAETAAGFALPVPHGLPRGVASLPEEATFGVTLSTGEKANNLAMRQAEADAIRKNDPHAVQWEAQRQGQLQQANQNLVQGLDPFGQDIAENAGRDPGELVSQGVQNAAASSKATVQQAYRQARDLPGEIHAGVFEGMSQGIKGDLSLGENPVIIDQGTTPTASKMLDYLDQQVSNLKIQNKADPFGAPNPENITGVNLTGIDQWRKNLSAMRADAFGASPPGKVSGDARAAQAVLNAFDDHIDHAVNGGMFTGDKSAVNAWNNARAANADYRSTFGVRKGDPVSRVVQKVIGDNVNDPLTPGKVMDQIVGSATNPSTLNIGVANRMKSILGEQSPEWIAAKQGVLQKIIQAGDGETPYGTGQVAQRLSKFLNSDMAPALFSPQEQQTLRAYADLNRQITMPAGRYSPSGPAIQQAMAAVRSRIGGIVGALIGRQLIPIPLVGELAGMTAGAQTERALEKLHSGVAKQLPLVSQQMQRWSRAQTELQAAPNPMTQRAAQAATIGAQKALTPLGIDLSKVAQGPGTANASDNQQNVPGPVPQQHAGGAIQQKAKGGAVESGHKGTVESASGAEKGPKATKVTAHYRGGTAKKRCGVCRMFRPPHACTSVRGEISPHGVCDYFEVGTKESLGHERAA